MVIDHLIPTSKGGEDSINNCVLTYQDANLAKSAKIDFTVERMLYIVKVGFAPRVMKKIAEQTKRVKQKSKDSSSAEKGLRKKKVKIPKNLFCVVTEDLFWADDEGIKILATSKLVTKDNIYYIWEHLNHYIDIARQNNIEFCDDAWLTKDFKEQIKSLWYNVNNEYLKIVDKTTYYDSRAHDKWGTIFFNKALINYLDQMDKDKEEFEDIFEMEDMKEFNKCMEKLCCKFPPPEKYKKDLFADI
jgi:hypothetical protein